LKPHSALDAAFFLVVFLISLDDQTKYSMFSIKPIQQFFTFSRSTQRGIFALFFCWIVLLVINLLPKSQYLDEELEKWSVELIERPKLKYSKKTNSTSHSNLKAQVWKLKRFDPNYAKAKDLRLMGFSNEFISQWFKGKSSLGFIKSCAEFESLNLLSSKDLIMVLPYLDFSRYSSKSHKRILPTIKESVQKSNSNNSILDINSADSAELIMLKGIGPVLASRIIKYRNLLGGYTSMHQLKEVYGLKEEVLANLADRLIIHSKHNTLPINELTGKELAHHPYISWKQAKNLEAYRTQHGDFTDSSSLMKVHGLDETWYQKIKAYLRFESQ
jgi:competence protein ComEA